MIQAGWSGLYEHEANRERASADFTLKTHQKETKVSIKALNPYINLNGTAAQAIELYKSALGANVENVMHFSDGPMSEKMPEASRNLIMHACLRIGPNNLMMSDAMPGQPAPGAGNVEIMLDFTDVPAMTTAFDALAAGGTVVMAPEDMFWGAKFGVLTDKFGVKWMFHCNLPGAKT
jgi:PhnB protein